MERNPWLDSIVDNVVRRSERDTLTKTSLLAFMLFLPLLIAFVFGVYNIARYPDLFDMDTSTYIMVVILMVGECAIASFLLFMLTNRSRNHYNRDREWMEAFIGYVESKGGDTRRMREIADSNQSRWWIPATLVSLALFLIIAIAMGVLGVFMYYRVNPLDNNIMRAIYLCYGLLIVQFVLTIGTTSRFPARHDAMQCGFTVALADQLEDLGIDVQPMEMSMKPPRWVINMVLFIITLGLYSAVLLILTNHRTNKHLRSQWRYETDLMMKLIRFEGGVGIEGYGSNQPKNFFLRFLKNAM